MAAITTFISLIYMGYYGFIFSDYKNLKIELKYYPLFWLTTQIILTIVAYNFCNESVLVKIMLCGIVFLSFLAFIFKNKEVLIGSSR